MREDRFQVDCVTTTSLRVASGAEGLVSDSGLWRRADGTVVIPGTSIAGAVRTAVEQVTAARCAFQDGPMRHGRNVAACKCPTCRILGDVRPGQDPEAKASKLVFRDAIVIHATVRVVDGLGLDRSRRTGSERRKFDSDEIAPGATVKIEIRGTGLDDVERSLIAKALSLLGRGQIPLGGRTAQGYGRLEARAMTLRWRDCRQREHLVGALINDGDSLAAWPECVDPIPGVLDAVVGSPAITFSVAPVLDGTFLVGDPAEAFSSGFDLATRRVAGTAELPATSLRGALRSGAERILRTLRADAACDPNDPTKSCAGKPAAERCYACRLFGNEQWASWLRVAVTADNTSGHGAMPFDHVAIDRFTGGASDGAKFDVEAARGGTYTVHLELLPRMPPGDRSWVLGLLALTLGDVVDGRIALGYGSARGHGYFQITSPPTFPEPPSMAWIRALWSALGVTFPEEGRL